MNPTFTISTLLALIGHSLSRSLKLVVPIASYLAIFCDLRADLETPPIVEHEDAIISQKDNVSLVNDSNVQEAINRRPELAFTNVRIDGEESEISLDNIPSDAIESVEVMKAVTPDLDADSLGSLVSLRSKPTYDQPSRSTKGSVALNYFSLFNAAGHDVSISHGGPLNRAKTFGGRVSARFSKSTNGSYDLFQDWGWAQFDGVDTRVLRHSTLFAWRDDIEERSIGLAFDYKTGERLSFFWRTNYVETESSSDVGKLQYQFDRGQYASGDISHATSMDAKILRSVDSEIETVKTFESGIGGLYETDAVEVDFKYTYQDDSGIDPAEFIGDFAMDHVDLEYSLTNRQFPDFRVLNDKDFKNATAFRFDDLRVSSWKSDKFDSIGTLNTRFKNLFQNKHSYLKFGLKKRDREENQTIDARIYEGTESDFANFRLSDALSESRYDDFLFSRYVLDTLPDQALARRFFAENESDFTYNLRRSREWSDPNTYRAKEKVDAYYGMINWENENWRWILGYRYEDATISYDGSEVIIGENGEYLETIPAIGSANFSNAFPNAHFRYFWGDNVTVIGSYTETIQRPWYADIVPSRSIDFQQAVISEGNPELRPTLFTNWDLAFDINYLDTSMLSIEFFTRSIQDTIFLNRTSITEGEFAGFEKERKENGPSAEQRGVRFTLNQSLDAFRLPKGLTLRATYTLQESEIEFPNRPGELLPLPWTSESFVDATLDYETEKWFFQLRYKHNEPMLARVGENAWEDKYQTEQESFGLDISWKLNAKSRLFFEFENLTSTPNFENVEGSKEFPTDIREIPWSLHSGIKFEL